MRQNYLFLSLLIMLALGMRAQVVAVKDYAFSYVPYNASQIVIPNILANDYIGNVSANLSNVIITVVTPDPNFEVQPDGSVIALTNVPINTDGYIEYQICDFNYPNSCSIGNINIEQMRAKVRRRLQRLRSFLLPRARIRSQRFNCLIFPMFQFLIGLSKCISTVNIFRNILLLVKTIFLQ